MNLLSSVGLVRRARDRWRTTRIRIEATRSSLLPSRVRYRDRRASKRRNCLGLGAVVDLTGRPVCEITSRLRTWVDDTESPVLRSYRKRFLWSSRTSRALGVRGRDASLPAGVERRLSIRYKKRMRVRRIRGFNWFFLFNHGRDSWILERNACDTPLMQFRIPYLLLLYCRVCSSDRGCSTRTTDPAFLNERHCRRV